MLTYDTAGIDWLGDVKTDLRSNTDDEIYDRVNSYLSQLSHMADTIERNSE
ncbi:MAG: hypothetical protein KAG20_11470 [Cocleimonas sp.]|nr:hypothetical protein [Cocleimonas sp.]